MTTKMLRTFTLAAQSPAATFAFAAPAQAADPVRIGVALVADRQPRGFRRRPTSRGSISGASEANARGGLAGRPIEFVVYDDRSDPATAARLYEKLITDDKVNLVMSSLGSATAATGSGGRREAQDHHDQCPRRRGGSDPAARLQICVPDRGADFLPPTPTASCR